MPDGERRNDSGEADLEAEVATALRDVEELRQRLDQLQRQAMARGTGDCRDKAEAAVTQVHDAAKRHARDDKS